MTSSEIRQSFLAFFSERGHRIVPSAPVVPYNDPTLLFTNAGMNQFKDVFLGTGRRDYVRAADTQKCIRVSGKHNDLEEVGRDTYHHTFFEMLGNWSFGDYYKKEAIAWAWELLTRVWGLERQRLFATVFETDTEAEELWRRETDISPGHILRFGKKDNFWEMGETGPCGPCSEIHFDLTENRSGQGLVNAGDPRVMEIWNLVFIQHNRKEDGSLEDLPSRHVDTGMGFERVCAVLQGKRSNYDTDVFSPLLQQISELTGRPYAGSSGASQDPRQVEIDVVMRVVADHVRTLTFALADGALPSNEGRGYVLRRILRRAARFGRTLQMHEPFIHRLVPTLVRTMSQVFPEISMHQDQIQRIIKGEEEGFNATLDRGLEIFESVAGRIGSSKIFPGEDAFKLYDTYGFPLDLTQLMAAERGMQVDAAAFEQLMELQRTRARESGKTESRKSATALIGKAEEFGDTAFIGYDTCDTPAVVDHVLEGRYLALDKTPFYVESGGQVDDTGTIEGEGFLAEVMDSFKQDRKIIHEVRLIRGSPGVRSLPVRARVDEERRRNIERNHSATHLLHEALRRVLGEHLQQQGSLVAPDRLRFDFNHFEKITPGQLKAIEDLVNEKIAESIEVLALNDPGAWLTLEEAKKRYPNVKMFFGDKYGDRVRIVEIDPRFSVELCGGTHVRNTREIGLFKILTESSVASGIRRVEAVTGDGLRQYIDELRRKAEGLDEQWMKLKEEKQNLEKALGKAAAGAGEGVPARQHLVVPAGITDKAALEQAERATNEREQAIGSLSEEISALRKEHARERLKDASSGMDDVVRKGSTVEGFTVASAKVDAASMDELKGLGDALRAKLGSGVGVLASVIEEKIAIVCVVTDDLIKGRRLHAGKIVGELARIAGGAGGGRPHLATAGGRDIAKLDELIERAPALVASLLSTGDKTSVKTTAPH